MPDPARRLPCLGSPIRPDPARRPPNLTSLAPGVPARQAVAPCLFSENQTRSSTGTPEAATAVGGSKTGEEVIYKNKK